MAYTLNRYYQASFSKPNAPRVIIYPNNTIAAQLLNHHKNGLNTIKVADCILPDDMHLPMPSVLMSAIDAKILAVGTRAVVTGLDGYIALLDTDGVTALISELRSRLDASRLDVNYLLSVHSNLHLEPRYEESCDVLFIDGAEESLEPLSIHAYSDEWVKSGGATGWKSLLEKMGQFVPFGNYKLILAGLNEIQAGIGNSVVFTFDIHEVAAQCYDLDAEFDDVTLKQLLTELADKKQNAENYLELLFGSANINARLALKRLLELPADNLWSAYIWVLRKQLPSDSYIRKVLSEDVTRNNLLRKYTVDLAMAVLSDTKAQQYATERADALKAIGSDYESLIVTFVELTKEMGAALPFLNCGTFAERAEIVRRASLENLSLGLPKKYGELLPVLEDYLSTEFSFADESVTAYLNEYRKCKISNSITDSFIKNAFDFVVPNTYLERDAVTAKLQAQPDAALLVIDAMGAEYMPLMLSLAKRRGVNIESQAIVTAKLPTETIFNKIKWPQDRILPEVKSVDNIVHDGAEKHEISTPEQSFAKTLLMFETTIMNRIAEGLARFARVVVTADHGASRLAVMAHNESKSITLPWDGTPDDWRYSLAPQGTACPIELEQEYYPETQKTYWIVRGYNRLPKQGGKLYELHGGATIEERLVPLVVFTRNAVAEVPKMLDKKIAADLIDEFEGLI